MAILSTLGIVPADFVHLVRHGEVNNPDRILYGTLDGFGLTPRGHEMASRVAKYFSPRPVSAIVCSPLQRTRETAAPLERATGLTASIDDRVIEGHNEFQGSRVSAGKILRNPRLWPLLRNPFAPSWAEPYSSIVSRMMAAIEDAANSVDSGDVVLITHQLPIWMVHRHLAGVPLPHFPTSRRCTLASVTTLAQVDGRWKEQDYQEPAQDLLVDAIDLGAA